MRTMPTVENAATWFNAKTVTHRLDVVDTRTADGSTVRFYNADGFEFMTLKSDEESKRFDSLFGEELVGVRHAEDGRLYAILKDGDSTREELVTATRPYSEDEADYLLKHDTTRNPALGSAERKEKRV